MALPVDPHQYTLKNPVSCCGVGLHTGRAVNLTIKPAPVNSGIRFFRSDCPGQPLQAHLNKVVNTTLATTIGDERCTVSTTEHLLAALRGFGIDNADIELDSGEVPIMDGSAGPFFSMLKKTGKKRQESYRTVLRITRPIQYQDGDKHICIKPYDGFKITSEIEFDAEIIQRQKYSVDLYADRFDKEIARARTFGYAEEVEELWAKNLALGGTLDNVVAIHWDRKTVLNEDGLRYKDEFIRHKILDLIGDLALLGCPLLGHVIASKTGHSQHFAFMKAIAAAPDCWELIALKKNGRHDVLDHLMASTRAAGKMLLPLFSTPRPKTAAA